MARSDDGGADVRCSQLVTNELFQCYDRLVPAYLFAYGTLQPGHAPAEVSEIVGRMTPRGRATVRGKLYDLGNYPGLILGGHEDVHGQLLSLPDSNDFWALLDEYEGLDREVPTRGLFRREVSEAQMAGRVIECWVYVANETPHSEQLIADGMWRKAP